jgi:hypothetical protein
MTDISRMWQLVCILLSSWFLVMGCVVVVVYPNNAVTGILLILAVIMLVRASLYPRRKRG